MLVQASISTPLGTMIAISDAEALCLLEFEDRKDLSAKIDQVRGAVREPIVHEKSFLIFQLEAEIQGYFQGTIRNFTTPYRFIKGSALQQAVWTALKRIPYGDTQSYRAQADFVGKPKAYRAIASMQGENPLCILLPCHRVILQHGGLGGYSSGLYRKEWLLHHEKRHSYVS